MSERDKTVDVLRGLGIITVVAGHAWSGTGLPPFSPYSFHMPLFFFLSGLFFREERIEAPIAFVLKNARTLLLPTTIFFLVYALFCQLIRAAGFVNLWQPFSISNVLFNQFGNAAAYGFTAPYWFIPCLFFVRVYFGLVHTRLNALLAGMARGREVVLQIFWALIYLLGAGFAVHASRHMYFEGRVTTSEIVVLRIIFAAFFYYAGYLAARWKATRFLPNVLLLVALYIVQQQLWATGKTLDFWMQVMKFEHPVLPIVTSLTGIAFMYGVAGIISNNQISKKILAFIGENGLPIVFHQLLAFFLVNAVLCGLGAINPADVKNNYFQWHTEHMWYVYVLAGIAVPIALDRYVLKPLGHLVKTLWHRPATGT
ncbi:acyltransferase family protein [Paraburkholderia dioscoreae]|uniref:Acyltransferase 3 n=1 Tax=Paraburkholderia dioscoreae TaxID=2604047 RepID=A0A5Q4Z5V0_9BURK|nr:acyltransferase family protein [Paraburkholderia dioscoreae]VVD27227.1 Acyltransferase 3 [Paraburkholderia dioscoreae]